MALPVGQHLEFLPMVQEVVVLEVMPVAPARLEADAGCVLVRSEGTPPCLQSFPCHLLVVMVCSLWCTGWGVQSATLQWWLCVLLLFQFQTFAFLLRFHMFKSLAVDHVQVQHACHTTESFSVCLLSRALR